MGYKLPPEPKFYPNDPVVYKHYELNLDKVKSVDDCKKILRFLCRHTLKPIRSDLTYGGFSEVKEYFEADEI